MKSSLISFFSALALLLIAVTGSSKLFAQETAPETAPTVPDVPTTALQSKSSVVGAPPLEETEPWENHDIIKKLVYVIPVKDEIDKALYLIMVRAMREAGRAGASAIVLDMDTFGGRVDAAINIRDLLVESKIPTFTYVDNKAISAGAFIAVATDTIVMGPASSIGGALPITIEAEGARGADEKFLSVFKAEMRKTAKLKGHPEDITDGFCNPDSVIPGLKKEGQILTLDFDQATSVGLAAFQAPSLDVMLEKVGMGDAGIRRFKLTAIDKLARILTSQVVAGILMLIGIGGIFLELKTPGVGLPGAAGLTALALYFFGSYLANLSGYMEWVFFVVGVAFLVIEIYVIPGFGITGIAGLLMIIGSLFFALFNLAPDGGFNFTGVRSDVLVGPALTILVVLLALIPFLMLIAKILPSTPFYSKIVLQVNKNEIQDSGASPQGNESEAIHIGDRGQAIADCHPTGVALISGKRVEVISESEFINRNEYLVVSRVVGSRIYINRLPDNGQGGGHA